VTSGAISLVTSSSTGGKSGSVSLTTGQGRICLFFSRLFYFHVSLASSISVWCVGVGGSSGDITLATGASTTGSTGAFSVSLGTSSAGSGGSVILSSGASISGSGAALHCQIFTTQHTPYLYPFICSKIKGGSVTIAAGASTGSVGSSVSVTAGSSDTGAN